jgi:hypothetical protein
MYLILLQLCLDRVNVHPNGRQLLQFTMLGSNGRHRVTPVRRKTGGLHKAIVEQSLSRVGTPDEVFVGGGALLQLGLDRGAVIRGTVGSDGASQATEAIEGGLVGRDVLLNGL